MAKRTRHILHFIFLLLLVGGLVFGLHTGRRTSCHIWVIHSHDTGYEQYREYNRLLEKELDMRGIDARLSFSYLNCNLYVEVDEDSIMRHWIDSVDAHGQWPDLILVTEDQATYALLSTHREELKRCPILFGGVRFPNYPLLAQYDNVTGIRDTVDFVGSMQVMREITGRNHAYTNLDRRFFDLKVEALIRAQMQGQPILDNLHWTNRLRHLYQLPSDSMSITGLSMRDIGSNVSAEDARETDINLQTTGNGNFFWTLGPSGMMNYLLLKFDATSHTLAIMSLREQFTGINNLFGTSGSSLLAGYFSSISTWAAEQADLVAQVLKGTPLSDLPVTVSPKDYYLDWNVACRFGLSLDRIPSHYHIVNIPMKVQRPFLYWTLRGLLYGSMLTIVCIATYMAVRSTRRRIAAIKQLQEKQASLEIASTFTQSFIWHAVDETVEFDDAFWSFLGQESRPITHAVFIEWIHPDYRENYRLQVAEARSSEAINLQMLCDFSGRQEYGWWEMRGRGERMSDGSYKMFGLLFNIRETKLREQELIEARKRMEEADLKESFLANMSHEIRTPLNAIVGFSNILCTPGMELTEEEKAEFMETINKNNDMLLKLVNDILDISRIESGYLEFSFEHTHVQTLVESVYQSYLVQAPKHLQFIYKPGERNLPVFIDLLRAQQVLMNFLTNAAKFTPQGSITLGWNYHQEKHEVEIYVQDTGIGLSKDDCILVFNRFFKKNEFKQGTGLGLSICRVIAERLHGRITVDSELDKGSRFSLWLKVMH